MRILIISDIHANLTAFKTVLEDAKDQWDFVWCLGDLVGYGPDPNECVQLLQTMPHLCLAGNHDWAALERIDIRTFNQDARRAAEWTRDALTPDNMAYLDGLPVTFVIGNYTLVHASPREPVMEYILEPLVASLNFPYFETPYCFVGHTHQPVIYEQIDENGGTRASQPHYGEPHALNGQRQIINPGSIGQPRDQNPDSAYGLLNTETGIFVHRRVPYDIADVQRRIRAAGLPERNAARLDGGW